MRLKRPQIEHFIGLFVATLLCIMTLPAAEAEYDVTLVASPPHLPANGTSTSTITVYLWPEDSEVIVDFSTTLGSVHPGMALTNGSGVATTTLTASTTVGTACVEAEAEGDTGTRSVPFTKHLSVTWVRDDGYYCAANAAHMAAKYVGYVDNNEDVAYMSAAIDEEERLLKHTTHYESNGNQCVWAVAAAFTAEDVTNGGVDQATNSQDIAQGALTDGYCVVARVVEHGGGHAITVHGLAYEIGCMSHSAYCAHDPYSGGGDCEEHYTMEWMLANFINEDGYYIEVYDFDP